MTQSERDFVKYDNSTNSANNLSAEAVPDKVTHELKNIVTLLITRSARAVRPTVFQYKPGAKVVKANGSLRSIFEWGEAARLDSYQRRAFEIFICAFLLTFLDKCMDKDVNTDMNHDMRMYHRLYRKVLIDLIGVPNGQVICLLYGPGGSGKSAVINLVVAYAREYCKELNHPFTSRTIVVSAMSGWRGCNFTTWRNYSQRIGA
jgi:hypothetical protein